ncbi:Ig-like domain-containing protein [Propionicimonas sp.]|uniref:Ig-like domain-containing protein n=1 Tax=Propionicimonas sp. TaxID=1955623 RepID=UPI0039E62759
MGRLRRGGIALWAALVLVAVGGVTPTTVTPPTGAGATGSSTTGDDAASTIVPGRYLVQVESSDRARVLSAITRSGATVDASYDEIWSGFSVTATDDQFARIQAAAGVKATYPVYRVRLDPEPLSEDETATDPGGTASPESTDPATESPAGDETDPPTDATPTASAPVLAARSLEAPYLTTTVLDVIDDDADWDRSTFRFTDAAATADGTSLTVPGRGTFTVDTDGTVSFTSAAAWAGTMDPVGYAITHSQQVTATGELTVTVVAPAPPAADPVTVSGVAGSDVVIPVMESVRAGGHATPQPASLQVQDPDGEWSATVHTGSGVWTAADGVVTFSPADGFTGTATARYRVADELGQTADANLRVTIHPVATDRTASTPYLTPVTVALLDDQTGAGVALDPASLELEDGDGAWVTTLDVAGEGTYTADPDTGRVTFAPVRGFRGDAAVTYRFADDLGQTTTATLLITVESPAGPTARDDHAAAVAGTPVRLDVLDNDTADGDAQLQKDSVCLIVEDSCVGTVSGADGIWTVGDPDDPDEAGTIEFTPTADTAAVATITYQVADELGQTDTAGVTVEVRTPPRATDDETHTPYRTAVTVDVLANDTPGADASGAGEPDPTSVRLSNGDRELTTSAGRYTVAEDSGRITFTPAAGFSGPARTHYEMADQFGNTDEATLLVTVGKGPLATPDTASTAQNVNVALSPAANDSAGDDGAGEDGTIDATSVRFTSADATAGGTSLVVAGEGAYAVADDGTVTFDPEPTFSGTGTPVGYSVSDSFGNTAESTITISVEAITPTAVDDSATTPAATQVTLDVLGNDSAGAASAPIDPASVEFTSSEATEGHKLLVVAGEGTWRVNPEGTVTFTPAAGATGTVHTGYRVRDTNQTAASATITVTIGSLPQAVADSATTTQNVTLTLDPLANDRPGDDGNGTTGTLIPSSVVFTAAAATLDGTRLVVAGEGVWTLSDGIVTFDPEPAFTGRTTPVDYAVTDSYGNAATASITVSVTPVVPTAVDDSGHGAARHAVTVSPLANDAPGDPSAALVTTSLLLTDPDATDSGHALTTSAGTWRVDPTSATVSFTPTSGFTGATSTAYRVSDANGTIASARITVTIGAFPRAADDAASTLQNTPVVVSPLGNDLGGDDGTGNASSGRLDPATLAFPASGGTTLTTAAGTWTANPTAGTVRFAPVATFTGTTSATYAISDIFGNGATATISITVAAVVPRAVPDTGHGPARHSVTVSPLANDLPGNVAAPLDPTTVTLTGTGAAANGKSLTTTAGTWTVTTAGLVGFSPAAGFTGTTATTYRVLDSNGTTTASATITVSIGALTSIGGSGLSVTTPQNVTVSLAPLPAVTVGDDGAGVKGSVPASSVLLTGSGIMDSGRTRVVQNEGTWRVNASTGAVSFDPESAFTGTAATGFQVTDSFGNTVAASLRVVVTPITPSLGADTANTPANHAVTFNPLANDSAGAATAPLRSASLTLLSSDTAAGAWTVNGDGTVTFTPATGVTGTATARYRVLDANNTAAEAAITVQVGALPQAKEDPATTRQDGAPVTIRPLANDTAGDNGAGVRPAFAASSLVLTDSSAARDGKSLSASAYAWRVGTDNVVTFTANWRFTGTATAHYRVTDAYGNTASATITVTVEAAADLTSTTETRLSAIGALDSGRDGSGIKVAIVDSGVDYDHPDLGGTTGASFPTSRVTKGYDYVDKDSTPMDCYGHGTKVAGIVGADGNPRQGGAYGVAPQVTLGAYRVFDCSGNTTSDLIIAAMEQAAKDGMNVINLSLGSSSASWPDDALGQAAANLVKKGVVVVAAVGNSGSSGLFTAGTPAVAPGVISLAAGNASNTGIESYSAMGLAADLSLSPTLTAPGSSVHTTAMNDAYSDPTGTSMAAPEVAGAVAQLLQARRWTTPGSGVPAKVAALLYGSASQLAATATAVKGRPEGVFRQGAGLVQVDAALDAAVTASPSVLKLGEGTTDKVSLTLSNTGGTARTFAVSAVTGASAAASTGSRTDVGNKTPDWAYAAVGFKASPSSVTVPAGGTAKVTVTITAPSKILKGRNGMLYGGWVQFTAKAAPTVSVPFAGVRGDYQKVRLLPSSPRSFTDASSGLVYSYKLPALAYRTASGGLQPTYSGTRTFHVAATNGQPSVMFHLDYPASAIRVKATNQKTKKSYYAVLSGTSTQIGKLGRDDGFTSIPFYGAYKNSKGKVVAVPAGTYKLQLRVLAPLGSSSKSSHWQTYTTRAFKLTWS